MQRHKTLLLLSLFVFWLHEHPACGQAQERIFENELDKKRQELLDLDALYLVSSDVAEKIQSMQAAIERAAWLEQLGKLKTARHDQLLALARLERLAPDLPVARYGFTQDKAENLLVKTMVRRVKTAELPAVLQAFSERILFFSLTNTGKEALRVVSVPFVLQRNRAGTIGKTELNEPLPEALGIFEAQARFPQRIEPGEQCDRLLLLPSEMKHLALAGIELQTDRPNGERFTANATFIETYDPDRYSELKNAAFREAIDLIRLQADIKSEGKP